MKIAIFGGTFDPVHLGHLNLLHCVLSQTLYKQIIIIPAKQSNFKRNMLPCASDEQRLQMLHLAVLDYYDIFADKKTETEKTRTEKDEAGKDETVLSVCDFEIKKGGISYTSDTVSYLMEKYNVKKIGLIIGEDHLANLTKWHDFEKMKNNVEFIICPRNEQMQKPNLSSLSVNYILLKTTQFFDQSSTAVRENLLEYLHYLSPRVKKYIVQNNLYN